jgi:hypothetical protein
MSGLPSGSNDSSLSARVTEEQGTILLELTDATGSRLATRTLASDSNCARLARSVAVVLTTWAAEVPEAPILPRRRGSRSPVVSTQPEMLDPQSFESESPQPETSGTPPLEAERPQEQEAVPYDGPLRFELALGPMGAISSSGATAAVNVSGFLFDRGSGFGGLLTVLIEGKQTDELYGGVVSFQHAGLSLGPAHRWLLGPLDLDVDADAVLGLLIASGFGYPTSSGGNAVQPGLRAGVRLATSFGGLLAWVGGWGLYWIGEERLELAPSSVSFPVPSWEVLVGAGVGYRVF